MAERSASSTLAWEAVTAIAHPGMARVHWSTNRVNQGRTTEPSLTWVRTANSVWSASQHLLRNPALLVR
jgi:hypothetical protein